MANSEDEPAHKIHDSFPSDELQVAERSCSVCRIIADAVTRWILLESDQEINLGNWKGFIERDSCKTCQKVVQYYAVEGREERLAASCPMIFRKRPPTFEIRCQYASLFPERGHNHGGLDLVPSRSLAPRRGHYLSIDPQKIDIGRLRQWVAYCDAGHREICYDIPKQEAIDLASTLTLVDVQQSCLVIVTKPVQYAALSYVWGTIPGSLEATTQNLSHLFTPRSLDVPETYSRIPRTILDAIALTKMMRLNYLWVDRLCIVQDNSRHFNEQLQQMDSIYANSYFTIIAADGQDANHGLRRIGVLDSARLYQQKFYEFSSNIKLLCRPTTDLYSNHSSWYTRAWTFQERAVSRRTLVFVNDTVYWECRLTTWHEELRAERKSRHRFPNVASSHWPSYALTIQPWPDLDQYISLIRGYNYRNLSFQSDALKAFTAIINAMSRSFRNGFLFGIPEFFFDIGLSWSTRHPLKRRESFPSWSWLGWSGHIIFEMANAWKPIPFDLSYLKVWPIIKWEKARDDDQRRVQIDNSYHIYLGMAYGSDATLSEGWKRVEGTEKTMMEDTFVHPNIRGKRFKYPFPVLGGSGRPNSDIWSPSLTFRAKKCKMFLGSSCIDEERSIQSVEACLTVELSDSSRQQTGVIESLFTSEHEYAQGDECELIAISKASAERRKQGESRIPIVQLFKEMEIVSEIKGLDFYEFYNVLWIEWKEGIAYRKALGRVWKDAWERQELEETEIVLG